MKLVFFISIMLLFFINTGCSSARKISSVEASYEDYLINVDDLIEEPQGLSDSTSTQQAPPILPKKLDTPVPLEKTYKKVKRISYAKRLQNCVRSGRRATRGRCGLCAKGVRHSIGCSKLASKASCGGGAVDYHGKGCMERKGFVNMIKKDSATCEMPGVIRVYEPMFKKHRRYWRSMRSRIAKKYGFYPTAGDFFGHIEFKGTDNRYHWGCKTSSRLPINKKKGNRRRKLVACYVHKSVL